MRRTISLPWLPIAWLVGVMLLLSPESAPAQTPKDTKKHLAWEVSLQSSDPFSELNQVDRTKDAKFTIRRGTSFLLQMRGVPEKGWYTYPMTVRSAGMPAASLGTMTVSGPGLKPMFPVEESEPQWKDYRKELDAVYLVHPEPFTWTQEIFVEPTAKPGDVTLEIKAKIQICDKICVWEDHSLSVPLTITTDEPIATPDDLAKLLSVKPSEPKILDVPPEFAEPNTGTKSDPSEARKSKAPTGLLGAIFTAILGGLISLLTPCVFPMIPITVSYFLKQAEAPAFGDVTAKRSNPLVLAGLYSATIILVMTLGGLLLMETLTFISNHWITNFVLGAIFLFFALSLLGMYEIILPSWLQDATSSGEGKGGFVGVFFMALTFSIISFTCVGPIYGSFITLQSSTATSGDRLQQYASVISFSTAFAAPFFVLALFPTLMKKLPRAGSWMNSVKVVMGFLEIAAAVKFLRAGEIAFFSTANILTFDLALGIYIAISLACGLYLLNLYHLPHDHGAPETIGVPRLLFSLAFITLGLYLLPGLYKTASGDSQRPRGEVFAWVESFLLPDSAGEKEGWMTNLEEALAKAKKENKLLFIDFTGQLCTNCKLNERNIFPRKEVERALNQHVRLKLYTDSVPAGSTQQPDAPGALQLRNEVFKSGSLPLYALVRPTSDGKFTIVRSDDQGLIVDIPAFVTFLNP
jgi:thiol:disulfide interchange protein DsbD